MYKQKVIIKKSAVLLFILCLTFFGTLCVNNISNSNKVSAMPFYDLRPKEIVLRSSFYTTYKSSSDERKNNIAVATKSLNNTLVDVGGEFSFNKTVGPRTEKNGYKSAKIIVGGEFVDGVGGGVCQVSTTLYNAVLLSGLLITECHPHSLPVGYIAPSFDAMVNSGSSDLKFINNTHNPIIIKTFANGEVLKMEIWGEPQKEKISRQSVVLGEIPAPIEQEVFDENGEYPELFEGERIVVRYSKSGLISEGYLVFSINGKVLRVKKIRSDKYNAQRGLIVWGKAVKDKELNDEDIVEQKDSFES